MKVVIDEKRKELIKKDVICFRIGLLFICTLFACLYLCIKFIKKIIYKEYLFSEIFIGLFVFFISLFGVIINIYYVNQVFRRDYYGDIIEMNYSTHRDFLLIHNININKKTKIYSKSVKHIFYKKNCSIVLTKDRHMYMIPNEVNIDILKNESNSF